jgi:hypothetical protein
MKAHYGCGCVRETHNGNNVDVFWQGSCINCVRRKISEVTKEAILLEEQNVSNAEAVDSKARELAIDMVHAIAAKAWKNWRYTG